MNKLYVMAVLSGLLLVGCGGGGGSSAPADTSVPSAPNTNTPEVSEPETSEPKDCSNRSVVVEIEDGDYTDTRFEVNGCNGVTNYRVLNQNGNITSAVQRVDDGYHFIYFEPETQVFDSLTIQGSYIDQLVTWDSNAVCYRVTEVYVANPENTRDEYHVCDGDERWNELRSATQYVLYERMINTATKNATYKPL